MRVDDLVTTASDRRHAADGLVSTETTNAVNSGIVGDADKSGMTLKADLFDRHRSSRGGDTASFGADRPDFEAGSDASGHPSYGSSSEVSFTASSAHGARSDAPRSSVMAAAGIVQQASDESVSGNELDDIHQLAYNAKAAGQIVSRARSRLRVSRSSSLGEHASSSHAGSDGMAAGAVPSSPGSSASRSGGSSPVGTVGKRFAQQAVGGMLRDSELDGMDQLAYDAKTGVQAASRIGSKLRGRAARANGKGLGQLAQKRYRLPKGSKSKLKAMQAHRNQMMAHRQAAAARAAAGKTVAAKTTGTTVAVNAASGGSGAVVGASGGGCLMMFLPAILAILVFVAIIGAIISGIGGAAASRTVGTLVGNEATIAQFLLDKGYDELHVAAIMGNMAVEAGSPPGTEFPTAVVEDGGGGFGICQWTGSRLLDLLSFAGSQGKDWTDLSVQLDFLWSEIQGDWEGAYTVDEESDDPIYPTYVTGSRYRFDTADDLTLATGQFCYGFERPGIPHISRRIDYARQYYEMLTASSYVEQAIAIANDDSHGYSLSNRYMNPDVDCSSFVYYALLASGFSTDQLGASPFNTAGMMTTLPACGFEQLDYTGVGSLQPGDILIRDPYGSTGHTEIYIGNSQLVGAHQDLDGVAGDSSGEEVDAGGFYEYNWEYVFRKTA